MAPPQDNAPARNPAGWPNQRGRRGKRERDEELQDAAVPGRARDSLDGREADEDGERGRFSGDGDSGSGAEGAQEQVSTESMNALAGYIRSSWARNKRARDVVEHRLIAALVIVGAFLGEGFALTHMIPAGSEVLAGRVLGTLDTDSAHKHRWLIVPTTRPLLVEYLQRKTSMLSVISQANLHYLLDVTQTYEVASSGDIERTKLNR
jgi:hypothetical protein